MISCRLPGENQILNVRSENGGSVGRSGFLNVAKDFIAEAITVREDVLESHRGERPIEHRCKDASKLTTA